MSDDADILVVGLGTMGAACAYQLAKSGAKVIGLDRFAPPHSLGSSHGETRITRAAVGEGADYVPMVTASHRIWREFEAETGQQLFEASGMLVMTPGKGVSSHHGKPDFVARSVEVAKTFGIPHETMTGVDVARRFTQFINLAGDEKVYYEPGGFYVFRERCIEAQLTQATALGADLRSDTEVLSIQQDGDRAIVETLGMQIAAGHVIISAGGWASSLLGTPFDRLLTVNRQVLHWFALDDMSADGPDAPVFIWMHGATDVDYLYGFPPLPGGPKTADVQDRDSAGPVLRLSRPVVPDRDQGLRRFRLCRRPARDRRDHRR